MCTGKEASFCSLLSYLPAMLVSELFDEADHYCYS